MRVSRLFTPRLMAAGVLALVLGCGNPTTAGSAGGDQIRVTLNNSGLVDVSVQILAPGNARYGVGVAAGTVHSLEVDGGTGDYLKFTVWTTTISNHIKQCQAGAPIVSVGGNPQPPALYGQVDISVSGTSIGINCSGGMGEWM